MLWPIFCDVSSARQALETRDPKRMYSTSIADKRAESSIYYVRVVNRSRCRRHMHRCDPTAELHWRGRSVTRTLSVSGSLYMPQLGIERTLIYIYIYIFTQTGKLNWQRVSRIEILRVVVAKADGGYIPIDGIHLLSMSGTHPRGQSRTFRENIYSLILAAMSSAMARNIGQYTS